MGKTQSGNGLQMKRGPWTPEEDKKLFAYIEKNGHGNWSTLPSKAGLQRCGKSCRIRWINYLRPDIKRGKFTPQEEQTIIQLHALLGNRWSIIAAFLNNRTDNEIKNYWNCRLKKRLAKMGIDPSTHKRKNPNLGLSNSETKNVAKIIHMAQWESTRLEAEARLVSKSKLENRPLNCLESEIISNLKAMPHFYTHNNLDHQPQASSLPPCLDILKAWKIVAGACVSLDELEIHSANGLTGPTYIGNKNKETESEFARLSQDSAFSAYLKNKNESNLENAMNAIFPAVNEPSLESFSSGGIAESYGGAEAAILEESDIWAVEPIDMESQTSLDDLWDLIPCDFNQEKPQKDEGFYTIDDGRMAGEDLFACSLSYCGRLGSLLMH